MVRQIILLLILPLSVFAQGWQFSNVVPLDNGVNSEAEELFPLIASDGKTLYFSRLMYEGNQGGKFSGADIWVSSFDQSTNSWSKASAVTRLNDKGSSAVVGTSADGNSLFIMRTNSSDKPPGIYLTKKTGGTWSKPELIPIGNLDAVGFLSFFVSPEAEVIFISMKGRDTRGEEDLYVTTKGAKGEWSVPKNLGASVNTTGFEISPFLSADKQRLYFSSNGHKGFGDADIFYCDRLYNSWDTWSAPKNLGDRLNSKNFDGYFTLYGDSVAYFASNRGEKFTNIFKASVVPGNDILTYGQNYLSNDEVSKMLGGGAVQRKLTFEGTATELTANQKELVYFIANKISLLRNVNIQLNVAEEFNPALTEIRLRAITNEFRESGLDNFRITVTNNDRVKKKSKDKTMVEMLFFK